MYYYDSEFTEILLPIYYIFPEYYENMGKLLFELIFQNKFLLILFFFYNQ